MSLRKIKRKLRNGMYDKSLYFNLVVVVFCLFAGYFIVVASNSTQEAYQEFKEIKSVMGEVGDVKNMDELKAKIQSNPALMDKFNSVKKGDINPSMIDTFTSNPMLKKQIEEKLKELQ